MSRTTIWLATFDGAEARFFDWDRSAKRLTPIDLGVGSGEHRPEFADRPVRTFSSASTARGTGDPKLDGERALEEAFVARVATALAEHAESFHQLIVAAPPRALGAFRQVASPLLSDKVRMEIGHDYVHMPREALIERLDELVLP